MDTGGRTGAAGVFPARSVIVCLVGDVLREGSPERSEATPMEGTEMKEESGPTSIRGWDRNVDH